MYMAVYEIVWIAFGEKKLFRVVFDFRTKREEWH